MSHLGNRLSALVDGELDGAELDRAHAHLAGCQQCRAEAAELRALKQKLRALMTGAPAASRPGPVRPRPARRRRYLLLGTVSLVVGLGTAAFTAGGGSDAAPGPRITPPVEMYSVEHAITTGEVPFPAPTAESSSNAPVP